MTGFGARVPFVFVDGETGVGERVVITPWTRGFENDLPSGCLLRVKLRVLVGVMFLEALLIGAGCLVLANARAALHLLLRVRVLTEKFVLLFAGESRREDPSLFAFDSNFDGLGYILGADVLPFLSSRCGVAVGS